MYAFTNFTTYSFAHTNAHMDVQDKLKWLLDANGWTQAELAAKLDTTQPTVNRWLAGSDPRGTMRDRINNLYEAVHNGEEDNQPGAVKLVGKVGADPSGTILFAEGDELNEWVPIPPADQFKTAPLRSQATR